jgi:hypothetical protein
VRLIQYRLDHQKLDCGVCERLYNQGDLGEELPCKLCPSRIMPEPDEITLLANQVYGLLSESLIPDQPPPIEFIFRLVGLPIPSEKAIKVYERLLLRVRTEREYQQLRHGDTSSNGNQSSNQDELRR